MKSNSCHNKQTYLALSREFIFRTAVTGFTWTQYILKSPPNVLLPKQRNYIEFILKYFKLLFHGLYTYFNNI